MRTYAVHEIFLTLQGEGAQAGRRAVLCRFAGCNLWSGREEDRATAVCPFCDTDFVGTDGPNGGRYHAVNLAQTIAKVWDSPHRPRFVVLTGGEPMLQVDAHLIDVLHRWECFLAVETNGTLSVPAGIDWVTVSPKAGTPLVQATGSELKVVVPQDGQDLNALRMLDFAHHFLQPKDGPEREANTKLATDCCLQDPRWRLSLQTHKWIGLP